MHYLHYRYVSEAPSFQKCTRLFQLMDDLEPIGRDAMLRDAFVALNVYPPEHGTHEERRLHCYSEFKRRLATLIQMLPEESPFVYGMVCYILGNAFARSSRGVFRFIEQQLSHADLNPASKAAVLELRDEEHQLRVAYRSFCELVVAKLLGDDEDIDFGEEWLLKENTGDDQDNETQLKPITSVEPPVKKLFPDEDVEVVRPFDAVVTTFLDQVAAHFEKSVVTGSRSVAIRAGDNAVGVSVNEYCGPTEASPECPLVLRIRVGGSSFMAMKVLKRLGVRPMPASRFEGRLEFSVLPNQLALLATWIAAWIRGQESHDPNPPPIPIRLSGENRSFEFCGDPSEQSAFVEPVAEAARSAFSSDGADWLDVEYLWSGAAREAHNAWNESQKGEK